MYDERKKTLGKIAYENNIVKRYERKKEIFANSTEKTLDSIANNIKYAISKSKGSKPNVSVYDHEKDIKFCKILTYDFETEEQTFDDRTFKHPSTVTVNCCGNLECLVVADVLVDEKNVSDQVKIKEQFSSTDCTITDIYKHHGDLHHHIMCLDTPENIKQKLHKMNQALVK